MISIILHSTIMLSKLRHHAVVAEGYDKAKIEIALRSLQNELGLSGVEFPLVPGGTLGRGFRGLIGGRDRYLKTYMYEGASAILTTEYNILSQLYAGVLDIQLLEVPELDSTRQWIMMDVLAPLGRDLVPDEIRGFIETYSSALNSESILSGSEGWDNFDTLLDEGKNALAVLGDHRFLSSSVEMYCRDSLVFLKGETSACRPYLCHGDLSAANIMLWKSQVVAIDWEDAFLGIPGYDYLYWLTFLKNRRYLSQGALDRSPWNKEISVAILVLIVLIKNEIAFVSGNYKNNRISFDDRLKDMIRLM